MCATIVQQEFFKGEMVLKMDRAGKFPIFPCCANSREPLPYLNHDRQQLFFSSSMRKLY